MILTIRTDKPQAEVGIYNDDGEQVSYHTWYAHRELSATLLSVVRSQLVEQNATFKDLTGVIVFKGPGSFTGLRIGITVANAMAYSLNIPIVGTEGDSWKNVGLRMLKDGQNNNIVLPEYGSEANVTMPKK